jgi:hypothetical protein
VTLIGAVVAVLAPVTVVAATGMIKIQDGNGDSKAQVDAGSLRVGDGSGAMTVNGTGPDGRVPVSGNVGVSGQVGLSGPVGVAGDVNTVGKPTSILAQGDCDNSDAYTDSGVLHNGETVVGIVLSDEQGGSQINTLTVSAGSVVGNQRGAHLFTLSDGQGFASGYAQFGKQLDFGPGIRLTENWSIHCNGQTGNQGNGLWIAYGY